MIWEIYTANCLVKKAKLCPSSQLLITNCSNSLSLRNFGTKQATAKVYDHIDGSLEDLAIIFQAFVTYLSQFQSYVRFKNWSGEYFFDC